MMFGQHPIIKSLILLLTFLLAVLANSLTGAWSGFISKTLFYSPLLAEGFWLTGSTIAAISIWAFETKRRNFTQGFWRACLTTLLTSVLAFMASTLKSGIFESNFFITNLLVTLAFLGIYVISFIGSSFCLFVFSFELNTFFYKSVKHYYKILNVSLSVFLADWIGGNQPPTISDFTSHYYPLVKAVSGFLGGLLISQLSFNLVNSRDIKSNLEYLRLWAIKVSTLGGTSFYNLDLSNVSFRNATLANTDLRAKKLYRTCFQGVKGLERARVNNRYLDLENPKVQQLLTQAYSEYKDFSHVNLKGAYLQNAEMRGFNLTDTELTGADFKGADLRGSLLIRTQLVGVDFTQANLTGCCIKDWSVNDQTNFTEVECDYVYYDLDERGQPTRRVPLDRNFEPREFEALYQEVGNVIELILKEGENWKAVAFGLDKLQFDNEDLGLEFKGIERRGDRLVVKVSYNEDYPREQVERQLNAAVTEMKNQLVAKEEHIRFLMGITNDQTTIIKNQSTALSNLSQKPFGNHFTITGGTISNISGSGRIEYTEASNQLRNLVSKDNPAEASTLAEHFLNQLARGVAPTQDTQAELIEKVLLAEANQEVFFQKFLIERGQQIIDSLPEGAVSIAFKSAIAHFKSIQS